MIKTKTQILNRIAKQSPHIKLFLYAIRNDETLKNYLNKNTLKTRDFDAFKNLIYQMSLYPHLYKLLNKMNLKTKFPEGFYSNLKENYFRHLVRNIKLLPEMAKAHHLLTGNKIDYLLFKGPASSVLAYNDYLHRSYSDIDIILLPRDLIKAHKLLKNNGFNFGKFINKKTLKHIKNTGRDLNATKENLNLDIHLQVAKGPDFFKIPPAVWENRQKITLDKQEYFTLGPEDTIHYLAIHSAKDGWANFKTMVDLGQLVSNKKIDWDYVIKRAVESKTLNILKILIRFLSDFININIPASVENRLKLSGKSERLYQSFCDRLFDNNFQLDIFTWYSTTPKCLDSKLAKFRLYFWFLTHPSPKLHPAFFKLPQPIFSFYRFFAPFYLIFQYKDKLIKKNDNKN